ncbi:MAG TPA: hypothetical protein VFX43_22075 [Chitinophagaceae bacterium]|jgi:hypothetical protein|nr:hypothetical protein [Chitinophagaceae bacterium]
MKKVESLPRSLDEIMIGQIVFDHSEWISLWGYMTHRGRKSRMDFIVTFETFNKLLRLSAEAGDPVQMLLVDQLEKGDEGPVIIDLVEHFGKPQCFDRCKIVVSNTGIMDENGHWRNDPNCLSIDEVRPHLETKTPAIALHSMYSQNLSKCEALLARFYELYLGYQELGFDEETSLQKADLEDNLKFKMAYYAWAMDRQEG